MANSTEMVTTEAKSEILPGMTSLAPLKQIGVLLAIAASIALGVYIALWSKEPPMRPLENLTSETSMDVINYLEQQQITYKVDAAGRVLVPQSQYKMIQIGLGGQGINVQDGNNDYYLNKDSGFGVSQRMEQARLLRNQEIQLTNTLKQFNGVRAVKVHLAIPKESSFIKNKRKPSASVLLNLYSRGSLSDDQAAAMVDLVSSSIPNMERSRVTITDQFGRLYHSGSISDVQRQTARELSIINERQDDIKSRVEEILNPIVGAGAYTVQVNVDMDFTRKEQTLQTFNPDLAAVRSERTIDDTRSNGSTSGVPGALSNQPPGAAEIPENALANAGETAEQKDVNKRLEAERNYDLDTTISHILPQVGIIKRISVSVGLDYVNNPGNAGEKIARPAGELSRIATLIQAAIGFSVQRGDVVSVDSFPFVLSEALPDPEPLPFYEQELFQLLLKPVIGLLLGLILIFAVLKPTLSKLSTAPPVITAPDSGDDINFDGLAGGGGGMSDDQVVLSGHDNLELPSPTVGQVKKLDQAKSVVNNNPTLVAQLVKSWIEEDGK